MITHHITPDPLRTDCEHSPLKVGQYSRDWAKVTCTDCLARRTNARDELARLLYDNGLRDNSCDHHVGADSFGRPLICTVTFQDFADAILAAGYRKPRTITTHRELDVLPDTTVIRDRHGDVFEKRADLWCGYETDPMDSARLSKYLPALVLWTPEGES